MPKTFNPIKKALVKKSLLKGKSIREALKDAGYAKGTQRGRNNGTSNTLVKVCQEEIVRDITQEITVKSVLESLKHIQDLAIRKGDFATATRCEELCGKWLAMFTDKQEISQLEKEDNQFSMERLSRLKIGTPKEKTPEEVKQC